MPALALVLHGADRHGGCVSKPHTLTLLCAHLCANKMEAGLPGWPFKGVVMASSSARLKAARQGVPSVMCATDLFSGNPMTSSRCLAASQSAGHSTADASVGQQDGWKPPAVLLRHGS